MNTQAVDYLQALSAFVTASTKATCYVRALYSPEEPMPAAHVVRGLRGFLDHIKLALKGLDKEYSQEIRQMYGGLMAHLEADYQAFCVVQNCRNPYVIPSRVASHSARNAEELLTYYVDWATKVTLLAIEQRS
jgi:hypothetical protein